MWRVLQHWTRQIPVIDGEEIGIGTLRIPLLGVRCRRYVHAVGRFDASARVHIDKTDSILSLLGRYARRKVHQLLCLSS
jgi:hypothetical protein